MSGLDLDALVKEAHASNDYDALLKMVPYARLIGIECLRLGDEMVFRLPKNQDNIGNPMLPAIHGGVIAGFMEHAAMLHLLMFMGAPHLPKIIDFSIDSRRADDYGGSGLFRALYAHYLVDERPCERIRARRCRNTVAGFFGNRP